MSDTATPLKRIYFDVTDIVNYAAGNLRVSGIQRVVLNLISNIARNNVGSPIYCSFFHPHQMKMVAFQPLAVLQNHEFDAISLLNRLGLSPKTRLIPPKQEIRKYLGKFSGNKPLRSFKKLEIYLFSLFYRKHLRRLGFLPTQLPSRKERECTQLVDVKLTPSDIVVILGSNWSFKEVIDFCKAHSACGGDVVQMVYDLIPYMNPDYCTAGLRSDFENWLNDLSNYVDRYICISEFTAKDLRDFLGAKAQMKSIKTIPLAHEFYGYERNHPLLVPGKEVEPVLLKPYVLCVGTIEIRKNGVALLRAWSRIIENLGSKTPKLIFAGKRGCKIREFEKALNSSSKLAQFVEVIESPSDADLVTLYQNSLFTVYPSLYEGWGLPVGEAAWFGKLCISSNTTSMPEVCGDLIDYVDPENVNEMTEKIEKYITHPNLVKEREEAIIQSKLRTWPDVADDIFMFLNEN